MSVAAALATNPALATLSPTELAAVAFAFEERRCDDGETLVELGGEARGVHVVIDGELEVVIEDTAGRGQQTPAKSAVVARLGPGQLFGLLAVIDGAPSSATVRARGAARVGVLSPWAFSLLCNSRSSLGHAFRLGLGAQVTADLRRLVAGSRLR